MPLAALVAAFSARFFKEREIRFIAGVLVFFTLYALGRFTPAYALFYHIPGVAFWRRPADATFLIGFALAVLAGYGFDLVARGEVKIRIHLLAGAALALFVLATGVAVTSGHLAQAAAPLAISALFAALAIALIIAMSRVVLGRATLIGSVAALMTADLYFGNGPNESTALPPDQFDVLRAETKDPVIAYLREKLKESVAPDRRDRIELAGIDFHWPNATLVHGLDHDLGYNPIRLKIFEDATGAGDHLALPEQREFSKLYPKYRSPLSDMLGLRYIATGVPIEAIDKNYQAGDFVELAQIGKVHIYENKNAMPRVYVATCAKQADFAAMIQTGEWTEPDYKETVLLEAPSVCHLQQKPAPDAARARIVSYENTRVIVEATAPPGGGWLLLNDVYHPYWFATLDGAGTPLLRANVMFRAVAIPEGTHEVRFSFEPLRGLMRKRSIN
ncbi:MAG: YfhO family protein [Methylocystis sp.]|nr:YfhO family protein [Methylocystis sp.]